MTLLYVTVLFTVKCYAPTLALEDTEVFLCMQNHLLYNANEIK
jgi:hypothetical protein